MMESFQKFLIQRKHKVLQGFVLGIEALTNWIKEIKVIAAKEAERQSSIAEKGRPDDVEVPAHVSACYELMEMFKEVDETVQNKHANRYNIRPAGMEHVELVKGSGALVPTGDETQQFALEALKDWRQDT